MSALPPRRYEYHAHQEVSEVAPTNGPVQGGTPLTLYGDSLGGANAYLCHFTLDLDPPLETQGTLR